MKVVVILSETCHVDVAVSHGVSSVSFHDKRTGFVQKWSKWSHLSKWNKNIKRRFITAYFASWYTCAAIHRFVSTHKCFWSNTSCMVSKGRMSWFRLWCISRFQQGQIISVSSCTRPRKHWNHRRILCAISTEGGFGKFFRASVVNLDDWMDYSGQKAIYIPGI